MFVMNVGYESQVSGDEHNVKYISCCGVINSCDN